MPARDEFEVFRGSWVAARDESRPCRSLKNVFFEPLKTTCVGGSLVPRFPPSTTGLRFLEAAGCMPKTNLTFLGAAGCLPETNLVQAEASKIK